MRTESEVDQKRRARFFEWLASADTFRFGFVGLLLVSCWTTVEWYLARMKDGSDEPWGVLALLVAIVFSVLGRRQAFASWRYGIAAGALLIPVIGDRLATPLIFSLFVVLALACLLVDRRCWLGHVGLYVLALPLISSLQFYGGYPLRWLIGKLSVGILNVMGVAAEAQGTVMKWRGEMIVIDAPCSGVQMLWSSAFLACVLICIQKPDFRKSLLILQFASVSAFAGNVIRNVLLFFLESGLVRAGGWAHDVAGLAVFAMVLSAIVCFGSRRGMARSGLPMGEVSEQGTALLRLSLLAMICVLFEQSGSGVGRLSEGREVSGEIVDDVRDTLFQEGWTALPLDGSSADYARRFPGSIELFSKEDRYLVVRVINRATRRYHLSADCYRAIGYKTEPMPILRQIDGAMWGRVMAMRGDERIEVRERVVSLDGQSWTDPSSWFWSAALGRSQGPWVGYSESVVVR
ncbi:archaeosortase/exosortase family protein [Pelagicoccus sp. SDUM812003]|uniref:archaeosortase/exosortase family protein n=1 Tax=Pelagicoccus sp. SDUM812003 TaxID=3041267 RepID=UPI002810329C|nr:archaeosortase/exosortase family protein [Pelagicoccus sp. SDUM812003]MDQ8205286.1 archaeosortase/exosortase family protein [Pelagicoccus sp. SDUM812003]